MSVTGQMIPPQDSLDDVLRVMNVASELRKQREAVDKDSPSMRPS
jgi:hypothetical protein